MGTLANNAARYRRRELIRFLVIGVLCILVTFGIAAGMMGVARAETPPPPPLSACVQAAPPQYDYLTTGRHIAFVCTNAAGTTVYPAGLSCLHSVCNPSAFSAAVVRVATSGDCPGSSSGARRAPGSMTATRDDSSEICRVIRPAIQ